MLGADECRSPPSNNLGRLFNVKKSWEPGRLGTSV